MAFFTRSKSTIPLQGEEADDALSEDDWEEILEERRTPDGRSSKTSYELRRNNDIREEDGRQNDISDDRKNDIKVDGRKNDIKICVSQIDVTVDGEIEAEKQEDVSRSSVTVVECKNPCINSTEPCYENLPITEKKDEKTEEVRYDFVVDRVLGVQV